MDLKKISPDTLSPKCLSGIDALYYYININWTDYTNFYNNILLNGHLENSNIWNKISYDYSKQFTFFELYSIDENGVSEANDGGYSPKRICKIGFKNLNEKDNLYPLLVQMDTVYMNFYGYKQSVENVNNILSSIGLDMVTTKMSRADLNTYVFGYDFSTLEYSDFSTRLVSSKQTFNKDIEEVGNKISKRGIVETFTLGNRSSKNIYLRIYNKRKELATLDYEDSTIKELLIYSKYKIKYGYYPSQQKQFWNVEFEIKRETFRQYNIETIEDFWQRVNDIHYDIVNNRIRLLERKKDIIHNERINSANIWNLISDDYKVFVDEVKPIERLKFKVYKKNDDWIVNRFSEYLKEDCEKNPQKVLELLKSMLR